MMTTCVQVSAQRLSGRTRRSNVHWQQDGGLLSSKECRICFDPHQGWQRGSIFWSCLLAHHGPYASVLTCKVKSSENLERPSLAVTILSSIHVSCCTDYAACTNRSVVPFGFCTALCWTCCLCSPCKMFMSAHLYMEMSDPDNRQVLTSHREAGQQYC